MADLGYSQTHLSTQRLVVSIAQPMPVRATRPCRVASAQTARFWNSWATLGWRTDPDPTGPSHPPRAQWELDVARVILEGQSGFAVALPEPDQLKQGTDTPGRVS